MNRKYFKYIYIILLLSVFNFTGKAQNVNLETTSKTQELLSRFDSKFDLLDSLVFPSSENKVSDVIYPSLLDFKEAERVEAIDKEIEAQISLMKNKTGLEFKGQAYVRPGSKISYDPDDPLVAYNAKLQAEFQWDIFGSSVYKRASKAKELKIQGELDQLNFTRSDLKEQILSLKDYVRFQYYSRLLPVISLHAENIDLLMETQLYLLEHGKISGEDLLKLINEKSEIDRQLIAIKADGGIIAEKPILSATYISRTDTAGILKSIKDNNIELKKLGLRNDLVNAQLKNTDYAQTMNISPFVRYSYYNRSHTNNTYNLDVGLSFNLPVSGEVAKKRKVLEVQKEVIDYEQNILESQTTNGIYLTFHDLEIYNEYILGEFQRLKNLREFLNMRSNSYGNVDGEYSRINRLQEYNAYLQAWERLLEYTYRRDCILLELQSYLLYEPVSKYIQFEELI